MLDGLKINIPLQAKYYKECAQNFLFLFINTPVQNFICLLFFNVQNYNSLNKLSKIMHTLKTKYFIIFVLNWYDIF